MHVQKYWYSKYASFAAQKKIFYDEATNTTQNDFQTFILIAEQLSIPRASFMAIYEDVRDIFMVW